MALGKQNNENVNNGETNPQLSESIDGNLEKEDHQDYVTGAKLVLVLGGLSLAVFLMALDLSILATAIPSITNQFHSTPDIGWYASAYALTLCALQPLGGKIYSLFPLKETFLVFFSIFLVGSLICGVATSSVMFIIGRAIAGAGSSGLFSGSMAILVAISPLSKRALYLGILGSTFGLSTILGPVIGGALTTKVTWRWCFYINLPLGVFTFVALIFLFKLPNERVEKNMALNEKIKRLDLFGCAVFIPSFVMFMLALQWGGHQYAWKSATVLGLFCGSGALFVIFLVWENFKGDSAMIPFSVLLNRSVMLSCLNVCFIMMSYILCIYYLPEWFQAVKAASPLHSGVLQLPSVVSQVISSVSTGLLVNLIGLYNPFFFPGAALLCIAAGLYTTFTPSTPQSLFLPYQILQGTGTGLSMQLPILAVQTTLASKPSQIPIGTSLVAFFMYFGVSVSQSIALAVFQNELTHRLTGDAGLNGSEVDALLTGGSAKVKETVAAEFPDKLGPVLKAYNDAITKVFFVPLACSIIAFLLATGIEWKSMKGNNKQNEKKKTDPEPGISISISSKESRTATATTTTTTPTLERSE